jgi:hypothetical protein
LQARRQVRRLADDRTLLGLARADEIADDHEAGGNADANPQPLGRLELPDRVDESEAGSDRALRIILVGPWVAEIHKHPVAHVLRDVPIEACNCFSDAAMVGADDLAQVLGVEPSGERRRTDEIAEHHGERPALGR